MYTKLLNLLKFLATSKWYWLLYIGGALALESVAFFYQYGLEEQPCVMCIQVRLLLSLLILISVLGLSTLKNKIGSAISHISVIAISIALIERSYLLLGTERGFLISDCGFDLGLPAWLALDKWIPLLYEVKTTCGYTPELLFGITMAEGLIVFSVGLFLFSVTITALFFMNSTEKE